MCRKYSFQNVNTSSTSEEVLRLLLLWLKVKRSSINAVETQSLWIASHHNLQLPVVETKLADADSLSRSMPGSELSDPFSEQSTQSQSNVDHAKNAVCFIDANAKS